MANSTVQDDFNNSNGVRFVTQTTKDPSLSGSPQSTLFRAARNESALPKQGTWDLLYAAAGEVAKMQQQVMEDEGHCYSDGSRGLNTGSTRKASPPIHSTQGFPASLDGDLCVESLARRRLLAVQFQQIRQRELLKQQAALLREQAAAMHNGLYNWNHHESYPKMAYSDARWTHSGGARTLAFTASAWPPLSRGVAQSGMHGAMLGNPPPKRESVGTGVFLPRGVGSPAKPHKKTACSRVLLPARVVHALKLNVDNVGSVQQPRFDGSYNGFETGEVTRLRNNSGFGTQQYQKESMLLRAQQQGMGNEVIGLPQEWTY